MSGTTAPATTESGLRTKSTGLDFTFGQMGANMTVSGETTTCMARVSTLGRTVENTRESISMTANTASESTPGRMAASTRVSGTTASSGARASTDRRTAWSAEADGWRASAWNGWTRRVPKTRLNSQAANSEPKSEDQHY